MKWLGRLIWIGLILSIVLAVWYANFSTDIETEKFPSLEGPKTTTFRWKYKNTTYTITETFYKTVYEYYNSKPKEYTYSYIEGYRPIDLDEKYLKMFLSKVEEDNTIPQIASDIKLKGQGASFFSYLDDDQIVELAVAFVQSIPYDYAKVEIGEPLARYPYETLYDNKGVCSDKSFLAALLIQELGYGVSLFGYEEEEHMALGIKCPKDYSSYNSNYCYTEVTDPGFKIGIIPTEDNVDVRKSKVPPIHSRPQIYEVADGRTYWGIVDTVRREKQIKVLQKEIKELEHQVVYYEQRVESLEEELMRLRRVDDYWAYNALVPKYNNLVSICQRKVNDYNQKVEAYNKAIKE